MKTILVLEDDIELNEGITYTLQKENYKVISAYSVREAMKPFENLTIDIAVLDVNLPDGDGFSFCKWINKHYATPVLFLSARDLEEDMLTGYELGAEDYVTKPFSMKILLKKIEVILSRKKNIKNNTFDDGFLFIDFDSGNVSVDGQDVTVTPTEFRLLRKLIENKGQLLTYSILLESLWDNDAQFVDKHTLAVNINRLRKKIENEKHIYISNVYGMGYIWK